MGKEALVAARVDGSAFTLADEARALIAALCSTFTEGFDTPELQEAKALMDTL